MILPNFLIVGAQKCGTTSMHEILAAHPETNMSRVKEINYFTNSTKHERGLTYYSSYFANIESKATGESSPGYICFPGVPDMIKNELGQIKIIILLRDPIKRAFSQYWDNRRHLKEWQTEKEIIDKYLEPEYSPGRKGYFSRGVYAPQVEKYIALFGRENVKVVVLEELLKNQKSFLQGIYTFLGLNKDLGHQYLPEPSNVSMIWNNPFYRFLLRKLHFNRYLPKHARRFLFFGNQSKFKYQLPSDDLMKRLNDFYKPYNDELAILLNRDLPW